MWSNSNGDLFHLSRQNKIRLILAGKTLSQCQADKENLKAYKKEDWKVLTVWECEIKDLVRLERKISRFLQV